MRSLWFVSLCLLFASCSASRGVERPEIPALVRADSGMVRYNLEVDFMRKHFSGMLLVKRMTAEQYRTVFTTYFGLKVFDLEFGRDSMKVHYCVEPMRRERMLDLFRNDFSMLFGFYPERMICESDEKITRIRTGTIAGRTVWLLPEKAAKEEGRIIIRHPWIRLHLVLTPLRE